MQTLTYRKAPFPKSVATTFVAHCRYRPDEIELSQKIHIVQFQKVSILPPQKGLGFPGGWGILEEQKI